MADGVLSRKTSRGVRATQGGLFALALLLVGGPTPGAGQLREIAIDGEVFRKTADGRRLADLALGALVVVTGAEGSWAAIDIDGWVPTDALEPTSREGHNSIISTVGGENLRVEPAGRVAGHLLQGFLLHRIEDRDGWSRVRRSGWVRGAALAAATSASGSAGSGASRAERPPALVAPGRELIAGEEPLDLHDAPGGGAVATVESGTPITVLERGSGWTRVRVEGWVRSDQLVTSDPDSVLAEVSAAALKASPDEYAGMRVRWTLQFVALQLAERERTDFYEGEPFMLARAPDPGDGFVYIAVPPELLSAAEGLRPLQVIDVLAQIRTGRSVLMGVPVLDLLAVF